MPTFFQRPENALKRAKEFIAVEKKQQALDALYDVIKSKKHRTWQKIHEPIMEQYLELCVELKKSHIAKEGLYQYKNICQQINIRSLEEVVRKYLAMAEEKTEAARQESQQLGNKALIDVDDLDVIATPENLLLSAVSGEDTQDRTDRAILTPWVKFLWESYRQCLDLLRNNNSVEKLYQDIAQHAFKFCLKYQRKTEFRKLCENLRGHLGHVHKHQHQQRAINLNNPESQAMHLETRLAQLDSAIQMELWQEAFKAVEDIHGLIILAKKHPKPALMANYYQKLGLVFWKSGNHLFHAAAWHRLFVLSREQRKNLSPEELQRLSSRVLCATLAIPIAPSRTQIDQVLEMDDNTMEKQRRLATLLMLNSPPTRAQLVKDLVKLNIIQHVHPELQNLYRWLEVEFHPLKLSARMATSIEFLQGKEELLQYVPALQDITVARLIKQVSQVYQTIEFARLAALAPFTDRFHLERVIVDAAKKLDLQVRIDHRTRSLSFGTDLAMSQKEDLPEGPYLQSMPSEMIRNQLVHMAQALHKSVRIITPEDIEAKREELRAHISNCYRQTARKEHQNVLMRRHIIEERKEELENLNEAKERQEQDQLKEQQRAQYEAEMARLEREAEERERQRRLDEERDIQRKATKEKLEQIRQTPLGAKIFADMDEEVLEELDMDQILQKQIQHLEKEKKEMQEKLRQQEKKVDYFERAKRVEELPLLKKQFDEESVQAKEFWEQQEKERISLLAEEREVALAHRDRLIHMRPDKDRFINRLKEARMSVYKDKLKEFEKRLTEERKKRLAERKEKRKEERKQKWIQEKEEEEQRRRDEEVKKQREEQERLEREAIEEQERLEHERREIEKAEYAEKLRKLDEMAQKKRQRELELEESERARQGDGADMDQGGWRGRGVRDEAEPKAWRPPAREGAGWREREKEREDSWRKKDDAPSRAAPERSGWRDRQPEAPAGDSWRDQQAEPSGPSEEEPPRARFSDRFASRDVRLDKNYSAEVERYKRDREEVRERDMSDRGFSRGGRDFGDGGRDFGDRGGRDFGDRGGRDFGGRDFGDRGGRDFGDRGGRDFGGRDFDRNRGGRDFGDRDRGGRDFGDRGGRDFGDRDRSGRDFGDRDRGGRDFGDRGSRDFGDRDRRGFGGGRDFGDRDRGGGRDFDRGPRRDFGDRDQGPRGGGREDGGSWRRGGDRGGESEDKWRSQRVSKPSPTKATSPQGEDGGDDDGWTTVRH